MGDTVWEFSLESTGQRLTCVDCKHQTETAVTKLQEISYLYPFTTEDCDPSDNDTGMSKENLRVKKKVEVKVMEMISDRRGHSFSARLTTVTYSCLYLNIILYIIICKVLFYYYLHTISFLINILK